VYYLPLRRTNLWKNGEFLITLCDVLATVDQTYDIISTLDVGNGGQRKPFYDASSRFDAVHNE